jgi:hypothetical protein
MLAEGLLDPSIVVVGDEVVVIQEVNETSAETEIAGRLEAAVPHTSRPAVGRRRIPEVDDAGPPKVPDHRLGGAVRAVVDDDHDLCGAHLADGARDSGPKEPGPPAGGNDDQEVEGFARHGGEGSSGSKLGQSLEPPAIFVPFAWRRERASKPERRSYIA